MDFFSFSPCSFFFHFIAYGLMLSGLGFDGFLLFFNLQLLFPFYCLSFKAVGFRPWWIFFVFYLLASFSFYCLWFKAVGLGFDGFFLFFNLQLVFKYYCLWFKVVGYRLRWIFFSFSTCSFLYHFIAYGLRLSGLGFHGFFFFFQLAASFSILLPMVSGCRFRLWFFFFFTFQLLFSILLPMV